MQTCAVFLTEEKLSRMTEAVLRMAGIAASGERTERIVIVDEKTAAELSGDADAVFVLYRDERWTRSALAAELAERYGASFAALRRPFDFAELIERVHRLPCRERDAGEAPPPCLNADPVRGTVSLGGREVRLTEREFALLAYFQAHAGRIVTRQELREAVWRDEADPAANVTDVYVSYLRKKLSSLYGEEVGAGLGVLTSVRGKGYLFRDGGA